MHANAQNDQPIGDLVKRLSEQTSSLVRKELALAQLELQEKGKRAGIGVGLFGGAGLVALYGVGALIAGVILLASTVMAAWLAALLVGVVLMAVAAVAGVVGKQQVQQAVPPQPEQAIQSVKRDVDHVKHKAAR